MARPISSDALAIDPLSGEFADRRIEDAYLAHQQPRTRAQLAFTLLFCSLYFLCFFATDLAALGIVADTGILLGARLLVGVTAGACAWLAHRRALSVAATRLAATVAEVVALGCFMVIAVHRPGEFHWHAMSMAIMLLVIYLYIPNRLAYALAIAASATAVFVALTLAVDDMGFADILTMSMLLALVNTFGALAARRYNAVAREEHRAQLVLRDAAGRDHLTGCYNRRYLHEHLLAPDSPLLQAGQPLTVILCDIDNFKQINDTWGHADGDAVLLGFSALLGGVAREGIDSVVRYGGEEFLLILPGGGLEAGVHLAEWLRARFSSMPTLSGTGEAQIFTTASFGVASGHGSGAAGSVVHLIDAADKLMYAAKRNGRDRVESLALPATDAPAALAAAA